LKFGIEMIEIGKIILLGFWARQEVSESQVFFDSTNNGRIFSGDLNKTASKQGVR
jgi:hypothetical protein